MDSTASCALMREADGGELILFVGPNYERMRLRASMANFEVRRASRTEDVQALKERIAISGRSMILIASVPEVEGILDRSAFSPDFTGLAYDADRVVYFGTESSVVIHPVQPDTQMRLYNGMLRVYRACGASTASEETAGLAVDHVG